MNRVNLCSLHKDCVKHKTVTCPKGLKINVKSAKIMEIESTKELIESNSVCTTDVTAFLRDENDGKNEATFDQHDYYSAKKKRSCGLIYGFRIAFGCAGKRGKWHAILYFDGTHTFFLSA